MLSAIVTLSAVGVLAWAVTQGIRGEARSLRARAEDVQGVKGHALTMRERYRAAVASGDWERAAEVQAEAVAAEQAYALAAQGYNRALELSFTATVLGWERRFPHQPVRL